MLPIHTRRHPHMRSGRNSRSVRDGRGFINAVTPVHAPRRPFTHRAAIHTVLSIHALRYPFTHRATRLRTATPTHAQWQEPPFGARRQELYQRSDTCSRTAPSIHTPLRPSTHRSVHPHTAPPIHTPRRPFTHCATRLRTATPTHAQWQQPPFGARRQELYQHSDTCSRTAPPIYALRRNLHGARCRSGILGV